MVGRRDEVTGQAIAAFVTLRGGVTGDQALIELRDHSPRSAVSAT